jgi:hypothetical protein
MVIFHPSHATKVLSDCASKTRRSAERLCVNEFLVSMTIVTVPRTSSVGLPVSGVGGSFFRAICCSLFSLGISLPDQKMAISVVPSLAWVIWLP